MNYVENVIKKSTGEKSNENVKVKALNSGVIFKFYDENPYTLVDKTETGIILGVDGAKEYKSNDTGEMERNEMFIQCANVIDVGPDCKNDLKPGDDIYVVKDRATVIPFMRKGYYTMHENNIICKVEKNE